MNRNYCTEHVGYAREVVIGPNEKGICLDCADHLGLAVCSLDWCDHAVEPEDLIIQADELTICNRHTLEDVIDAGVKYCSICQDVVNSAVRKDILGEFLCENCIDSEGLYICSIVGCNCPVVEEANLQVLDDDNQFYVCFNHDIEKI